MSDLADKISPRHYADLDPEPIDVIEGWGLGFSLGNAVKYIARAGRKPGEAAEADLAKAAWYLARARGEDPAPAPSGARVAEAVERAIGVMAMSADVDRLRTALRVCGEENRRLFDENRALERNIATWRESYEKLEGSKG